MKFVEVIFDHNFNIIDGSVIHSGICRSILKRHVLYHNNIKSGIIFRVLFNTSKHDSYAIYVLNDTSIIRVIGKL